MSTADHRALRAAIGVALLTTFGCRAVLGIHSAKLRQNDTKGPIVCADAACVDAGLDAGDQNDGKHSDTGPTNDTGASGSGGPRGMNFGSAGVPAESGNTADGGSGSGGNGGGTEPECADGELKCEDPAQAKVLRCEAGHWASATGCDAGSNCDSRPGVTQGVCQPIAPECAGQAPDALVCVGSEVHRCGPDLVSVTSMPCAADTPACVGGRCVECDAPEPALLCADAATPRSCGSQHTWVNGTACSGTTPNCLDGLCVELCDSGATRCSNEVPQSCVGRTWQNGTACSGDQPVCSNGQCVEIEAPEDAKAGDFFIAEILHHMKHGKQTAPIGGLAVVLRVDGEEKEPRKRKATA